ncbi:MAG: TspO/MBR family protein [Myxococcota bacterium]|nr:TspO/MBR family protein [Myxococcota bacterium]
MTYRTRSWINIICFIMVLTVNYLANALPINGVTQKELSAEYSIHITPAGYVFAIWGLIYTGLITYIILQALGKWVEKNEIRVLDLPFALSCGCNALWLVVWHYRYLTVSVLVMLGLLGTVAMAYMRLQKVGAREKGRSLWIVQKTFGIYLGWVGLATILNISIWLDALGWSGAPLSGSVWGAILLVIAALIYLYWAFSNRDAAPLGVLAWASLGIGIKNQSDGLIWIVGLGVSIFCIVSLLTVVIRGRTHNTMETESLGA